MLTIYGYGNQADIGGAGFIRLRKDIAYMLSDEIGGHYAKLIDNYYDIVHSKDSMQKYDSETKVLEDTYCNEHGNQWHKVFDFLYANDINTKLPYGTNKALVKLIDALPVDKWSKFMKCNYGYSEADKKHKCTGETVYKIFLNNYVFKKPLTWD